jgi:hypothetical protein
MSHTAFWVLIVDRYGLTFGNFFYLIPLLFERLREKIPLVIVDQYVHTVTTGISRYLFLAKYKSVIDLATGSLILIKRALHLPSKLVCRGKAKGTKVGEIWSVSRTPRRPKYVVFRSPTPCHRRAWF